MTPLSHIRNFSIVAHIDHGKSTLADRLIQSTNTVADRDMKEQLLDSMDIERERGITIKANTVRIDYKAENGETYVLNLIDTPGRNDFLGKAIASLPAVETMILVVDPTSGLDPVARRRPARARRRGSAGVAPWKAQAIADR